MRAADLKGYQYSRDDVDARSLANQYAQILGNIFTHEMKPMEVEILVAEVGLQSAGDQMFHILYDGTVVDARDIAAIGGDSEAITTRLVDSWSEGLDRSAAIRIGVAALAGADREIAQAISRSRNWRGPTAAAASTGSPLTCSPTRSPERSTIPLWSASI